MPHAVASTSSSAHKGAWRPTKIMNMRDLSRDDDFLSHLLVEKLGTGAVPLVVHKMDPTRKLPKTDADLLLQIVRRLVAAKVSNQVATRQAVDELLCLPSVRYYLKDYTQKQINAFATHASRYFELYLPTGSIEIAHTSRYAHRTGKSELCTLATRPLLPGQVITELKGSMADLTEEEDKELKRTDEAHPDGLGIRRDFSVIHSKQLKKNHLFLGPARFVNHDCDHNAELFREGRYITFRVIKPIGVGEEVTAHYGDGYFGRKNRHCLCSTCERKGRGGYAPEAAYDDEELSDSAESGADRALDSSGASTADENDSDSDAEVNVNERRTRRGVYAVVTGDQEEGSIAPMELDVEVEVDHPIGLPSIPPSRASVCPSLGPTGLLTPDPESTPSRGRRLGRGNSPAVSVASSSRRSNIRISATPTPTSTPYNSAVNTRTQKAREVSASTSRSRDRMPAPRSVSVVRQLVTPPLTVDSQSGGSGSAANSVRSSSRIRSRGTADKDNESVLSTPVKDKGKSRATASVVSDVRDQDCHDLERDPDTRTLRPRMAVSLSDHLVLSLKQPEDRPRGVDGKVLPTCVTCSNVLPVISMDSEVIWGLSIGRTGKRGRPRKHIDVECPRCMRHFEIYNTKWPERVPGDGSLAFVPAPRPPVKHFSPFPSETASNKGSSMPASSNKRPRDDEDSNSRPPKRKREFPLSRPRGRPPKNKVSMSSKAKEILSPNKNSATNSNRCNNSDGRRSGRARFPSLKMRESEPLRGSTQAPLPQNIPSTPPPEHHRLESSLSPPSASDHGPSLVSPVRSTRSTGEGDVNSSPSLPSPTRPPHQLTPKSLAVAAQPRDANGRFGKKASTNGMFMRKNLSGSGKRAGRSHKKMLRKRGDGGVTVKKEQVEGVISGGSDGAGENKEGESSGDEQARDQPTEHEGAVELGAGVDVHGGRSGDAGEFGNSPSKGPHSEDEERREMEDSVEDDEDNSNVPDIIPVVKVGVALLGRPNPVAFARRKWISTEPEEHNHVSTDEDSDPPVTPDDGVNYSVASAYHSDADMDEHDEDEDLDEEDEDEDVSSSFSSHRPRLMGGSIFKPSPLNLARRRWAPLESKFKKPVPSREASPHLPRDLNTPDSTLDGKDPEDTQASSRSEEQPWVRRAPSMYPLAPSATHPLKKSWLQRQFASASEKDPEDLSLQYPYSDNGEDYEMYGGLSDLSDPDEEFPSGQTSLHSNTDSERIVERLVALTDSRPGSSLGNTPSCPVSIRHTPPPPTSAARLLAQNQTSPGMAWKQTVLLPTEDLALLTGPLFSNNFPKPPTQLVNAGWEADSSDIDN